LQFARCPQAALFFAGARREVTRGFFVAIRIASYEFAVAERVAMSKNGISFNGIQVLSMAATAKL